jgi:hypothetical protein
MSVEITNMLQFVSIVIHRGSPSLKFCQRGTSSPSGVAELCLRPSSSLSIASSIIGDDISIISIPSISSAAVGVDTERSRSSFTGARAPAGEQRAFVAQTKRCHSGRLTLAAAPAHRRSAISTDCPHLRQHQHKPLAPRHMKRTQQLGHPHGPTLQALVEHRMQQNHQRRCASHHITSSSAAASAPIHALQRATLLTLTAQFISTSVVLQHAPRQCRSVGAAAP